MRELPGRSEGAVEFKHANVSAALVDLGYPYVDGYKPRGNYQKSLLPEVIEAYVAAHPDLLDIFAQNARSRAAVPTVDDILAALTAPPVGRRSRQVSERLIGGHHVEESQSQKVNFLEIEARNRSLGRAGEEFVLNFERARLSAAGRDVLAGRIEHVAETKGDGEGYDVLSYEANGRERLIEVKTTKHGIGTPFFVSAHEVAVSTRERYRYHLYRVFRFVRGPKVFTVPGSFEQNCDLRPVTFEARVA